MKSLGEFIVEQQSHYPDAKGDLTGILSALQLSAKILHRDINKAATETAMQFLKDFPEA